MKNVLKVTLFLGVMCVKGSNPNDHQMREFVPFFSSASTPHSDLVFQREQLTFLTLENECRKKENGHLTDLIKKQTAELHALEAQCMELRQENSELRAAVGVVGAAASVWGRPIPSSRASISGAAENSSMDAGGNDIKSSEKQEVFFHS